MLLLKVQCRSNGSDSSDSCVVENLAGRGGNSVVVVAVVVVVVVVAAGGVAAVVAIAVEVAISVVTVVVVVVVVLLVVVKSRLPRSAQIVEATSKNLLQRSAKRPSKIPVVQTCFGQLFQGRAVGMRHPLQAGWLSAFSDWRLAGSA